MLSYQYTARDPKTGEKIKAEVQADSEYAAAKLIRDQGLAPLDIKLHDNEKSSFNNKVKTKDRIVFSRQLSTLINAGLPLVQSLHTVSEQTSSRALRVVVEKIIASVEAGKNFSDAIAEHPKVFSQVYVSLVSAGEASGTLDQALERISLQQEKDAEILAKVRGAMAYPLIVVVVMAGVVTFMMTSVLPQVKELYKGIPGVKLPFITQILLAISNFIINFWWLILVVIAFGVVMTTRWAQTGPGKLFFDRFKMKTPPINRLFMKVYMARFARTGSTLVASGVPLIQMLDITGNAVNNILIKDSIKRATEQVRGGKALSSALEGDPNFLVLVPNMLRIGEQSGSMQGMLEKTADYYEKEVDNEIKTISTIIEPMLMVLLGIVAITIVSAILLPIYSLVGKNIIK